MRGGRTWTHTRLEIAQVVRVRDEQQDEHDWTDSCVEWLHVMFNIEQVYGRRSDRWKVRQVTV